MNRDLEGDLQGDAELQAFVSSLRASPQARVTDGFASGVLAEIRVEEARARGLHGRLRRLWSPEVALSAAACLVAALAFAALVCRPVPRFSTMQLVSCQTSGGAFSVSSSAPYVQAFAVTVLARDPTANPSALDAAVGALVRTQTAEGGWANAQLSARNAAALAFAAQAGVTAARTASRRALRYLRTHGIGELSVADLAREARAAVTRLGATADTGLVCSAALCSAN